jgi:hypothetical protein
MQDTIEQLCFCMLAGCVLSSVVAATLSRPERLTVSNVLSRLLLAGVPVYLGVDYLLDQGPAMIAGAGASFAFWLYCFRGWWLPEHLFNATLQLRIARGATYFRHTSRRRRAAVASAVLRYRVDAVVHADRLEQPTPGRRRVQARRPLASRAA